MTTQSDEDDNEKLAPEDVQLIDRFVAQCKALKWGTQNDISDRLEVSARTISAIFTRNRLPATKLLRNAAREGMDVLYVITGESNRHDAAVMQMERETDRLKTVLRSVVAIIEGELPGTRASIHKEPAKSKLTKEQEIMLAKFANADAQLQAIVSGILDRVELPPGIAEKPS